MSVVYFIGCDASDLVKVGFATDLKKRLGALQIGCPFELEIIGTLEGPPKLEREIHQALSGIRRRFEWFEREPALAFLDEAKRTGVAATIDRYVACHDLATAAFRRVIAERVRGATDRIASMVAQAINDHGLKSVALKSGIDQRELEYICRRPKRIETHHLLSISAGLGIEFTSQWLKMAGQGAFALPAEDTATIARAAADGKFDEDEKPALHVVGHRMVEHGKRLVAL